jgi:hypothetical protein
MKKTLSIMLALSMICFCSTLAFAATTPSPGGSITLDASNANCDGPDLDVDISAGCCAAYSAAAGAGGYNGSDGQIMCVITGSSKADPDLALYFGVRSSQDADDDDDNQVYQTTAGNVSGGADDPAPITPALCDGETDTDINADWHVRGGS